MAGMPILGSAVCLASLAGTPGPVLFLFPVCPVAPPESLLVFWPGRRLVPWLGTGPPVPTGGILSLQRIGTHQLSLSLHFSLRTRPLEANLSNHPSDS